MPLGSSGFVAAVGPNRYTDESDEAWDFYSIDVERPQDVAFDVYFEREYPVDDLPSQLIDETAEQIVTFDEASRVVTFTLGNKVETYTLPDR